MPPLLAFFLTAGLVFWLFRRDFREQPNVTNALWIPTLWLLIIGSRTVAQWLQLLGNGGGSGSDDEGTPVDAACFFLLILAGAWVLWRRQVRLGEVFRHNRLLMWFLVYCLISVLWADLPFVSFKRWIKILGHPIMTLVLFTEPDPQEAINRLMKRCAYLLIPFSILFVKYYVEWGRTYSPWGGPPMLTGVTLDKNTLGSICLIFGLYFFCRLLQVFAAEKSRARKAELFLCAGFLLLIGYLFYSAKSSTSDVAFAIGVATALFLGLPFVNHRNFAGYVISFVVVAVVLETVFGVYELTIGLLGKDPSLTDRLPLWHEVLALQPDALVGAGFENFWAGARLDEIWSRHWWHPRQAHNGYLETYLNLGLIGLVLMVLLVLNAFARGCRSLAENFQWGRFRVAFVMAFIFYNWTEAAFKATHPVWFVFYIVAIEYPRLPPPENSDAVVAAGRPA